MAAARGEWSRELDEMRQVEGTVADMLGVLICVFCEMSEVREVITREVEEILHTFIVRT